MLTLPQRLEVCEVPLPHLLQRLFEVLHPRLQLAHLVGKRRTQAQAKA
jgi:hypothetical protein